MPSIRQFIPILLFVILSYIDIGAKKMGHTHHTYDEFDRDGSLTRPLYGHVTDLKSGDIPAWVRPPQEHKRKTVQLLGIDHNDPTEPIPKSKLPAGVTRQNVHSDLHSITYKFTAKAYLEAHREQSANDDVINTVRFDLYRGRNYEKKRGVTTVPSDIEERIDAIKETSYWDRKVDGYHAKSSGWELHYKLGNRGGIQDVHIVADLNR
jgi:hypothetical protein